MQISAWFVMLACFVQGCARESAKPKEAGVSHGSVYQLRVERTFADAGAKIITEIVRNGSLERVQTKTEFFGERARQRVAAGGSQSDMSTTLYDFAAHKVYWIGFPGMQATPGGCSWGHLRSARAPVDEDFVTGTTDALQKMSAGREQKPSGASAVNGVTAHIVAFVGGNKPAAPEEAAAWPVRVFLADESGTLLKAEAEGPSGKPITLFEVTQLVFGGTVPSFAPPQNCTFGNAEIDDSGAIHAHAETTIKLEASATLNAATGEIDAGVNVTSSGGK